MRAQQFAGGTVEDGLDEAAGFPECRCLAVANEGKATDAAGMSPAQRFLLRQADTGYLRMAIGASGNAGAIKFTVAFPKMDVFDTGHRFMACLVCQPRRATYVAD